MAAGTYDLRSQAATAAVPDGVTPLRWHNSPGTSDTIESGLGWSLDPWQVSGPARDLLRVAGGAYLADALTNRGTTFTRDISLTVAVSEVDRWTSEVTDQFCDLLYWLTGDQWQLIITPDDTSNTHQTLDETDPVATTPVALLSGGLDSYLGAIHLLAAQPDVHFIGHKDAANVIKAAQSAVHGWLSVAYSPAPSYTRVPFRPAAGKRERSSRSRSLLFSALGIAAAASRGAETLYVPENGYTSLNLPLHPNRAGALTTRSTHPLTFQRLASLLDALGIQVALSNPFQQMTKGEVMATVASQPPPARWLETSWQTISCGKLDGGRMPGGNPNFNCGLCVPCMVRRGTYIAADQPDQTRYLVNEMTGSDRTELIRRRQGDLDAILYATGEPVDDDLIDSQTWPSGFDLDAAQALAQRGLDELAAVPHP